MLKLYTLADLTPGTSGVAISATSIKCTTVIVQCKKASTGPIYLGDSNVAITRGVEIESGESMAISADSSGRSGGEELDLADLYICGNAAADIVKVSYLARK